MSYLKSVAAVVLALFPVPAVAQQVSAQVLVDGASS